MIVGMRPRSHRQPRLLQYTGIGAIWNVDAIKWSRRVEVVPTSTRRVVTPRSCARFSGLNECGTHYLSTEKKQLEQSLAVASASARLCAPIFDA